MAVEVMNERLPARLSLQVCSRHGCRYRQNGGLALSAVSVNVLARHA